MENVLDPSVVKDLLNHIYEKRKATAFQIESFTKAALAKEDTATIVRIIEELTELTRSGTHLAKMGAITALGSVLVALGLIFIAFFLEQIVRPIFATFRDTDARVRYYACESLYNIAKIARGEILLYFNEVFDILCVLVTDTESLVKNAADILDRLIKDIVSAKLTSYVSILLHPHESAAVPLHIVDARSGVARQLNEPQDAKMAFLLPKFMPTLLERMYVLDPFAKKFLIGWLELFDDIPALELITFLPNILAPLIRFLANNAPSDVRIETHNLLDTFLKEIGQIHAVKMEVKRRTAAAVLLPPPQGTPPASPAESDTLIDSSGTTVRTAPADDAVGTTGGSDPGSVSDAAFTLGQDIFIDYPKIIDILLSFVRQPSGGDIHNESHEVYLEIEHTVLNWLQELLDISPASFIKFFPECVAVTLKNIEHSDTNKDFELLDRFLKLNLALQGLVLGLSGADEAAGALLDAALKGINREAYDTFVELHLSRTLETIVNECFVSQNELARITALEWLIFLYSISPASFFEEVDGKGRTKIDLTALLRLSTELSNEVILKILQLLSIISETNQDFFKTFMVELITFFGKELRGRDFASAAPASALTRDKIEFIVRKLCVTLSAEKIFKTLSEALISMESLDLDFLNMITITLNNILLTTHELAAFRRKLKSLDFYKLDDWALFATLFQSWCHNAPSALLLCLLTSNYELAFLIIKNLGETEIDFELLTQLDILVQLLELPIFVKLRLQLLEPDKNPNLHKTLYGLLMILPQLSTFTALQNRLLSVSHVGALSSGTPLGASALTVPNPTVTTPGSTPGQGGGPSAAASASSLMNNLLSIKRKRVYEMLDKFAKIQERHRSLRHLPPTALTRSPSVAEEAAREPLLLLQGKYRSTRLDRTVLYDGRKDYFSAPEPGKRKVSGKFGLSRIY
jgi:vacuole morphology and inheritance protein 14